MASWGRAGWRPAPCGATHCWTSSCTPTTSHVRWGSPSGSDPEAARTAADWAWARVFPFFPGRRLRGLRLVADDIGWSRGHGLELRGPVESLLLVSTGRPAGLSELEGPGLAVARERFRLTSA